MLIVLGRERLFTRKFSRDYGRTTGSVCGRGSDKDQTRLVVKELSALFVELRVRNILDIPCGDYSWFREIRLPDDLTYVGADISQQLIDSNKAKYSRPNVQFVHLDIVADHLPSAQMVLCRDCLIHLSNRAVRSAIRNICKTDSKYLVTTTYTNRLENRDIVTGGFRTLNLQIDPFFFPPPIRLINEGCTQAGGQYQDKSLGVWLLDDIRARLRQ